MFNKLNAVMKKQFFHIVAALALICGVFAFSGCTDFINDLTDRIEALETGSESRNMELSEERAENVAAAIKAAGIASDRVYIAYKGDRENPFDTPEKNRVAICVVAE